jgi:death-on-curing protein
MASVRYLTLDELIYVNGKVLNSRAILGGTKKIRDIALLEAAAARPMTSAFGEDAYPTVQEKAAALLHSIARNHPFTDGNKRTATVATLFMLEVNGLCVTWQAEEALEAIVALAEGKRDMEAFAAWLPTKPCPPTPEQDADADMQTIEHLMNEHRWLLDELAKR